MGAPVRSRQRRKGQALVEFALVLPVFVLILFGVIDLGRFVYTDSTLSQAAREGARVGAVEAGWVGIPLSTPGCVASDSDIDSGNPGAHACPPDTAGMKADIVAAINQMVVAVGPIAASDVYISCNTGQTGDLAPTGAWTESSGGNGCVDDSSDAIGGPGDLISVRIVYTFQPITPVVGPVSRSASATMVIN